MKRSTLIVAWAFFILNMLDAGLTAWAVKHGFSEGNPLMAAIIAQGVWVFVAFKLFISLAIIGYAKRWSKHPLLLLSVGAAMLGLVDVWNVYALTLR